MAEDRPADSCAAGICVCSSVSVAGAASVADDAWQPRAGGSGGVAAGLRLWLCEEECRADPDGALCLYAEPAVSGLDDDCVRVCGRGVELDHPFCAGRFICRDLSAYNSFGRGLSAGALCGV